MIGKSGKEVTKIHREAVCRLAPARRSGLSRSWSEPQESAPPSILSEDGSIGRVSKKVGKVYQEWAVYAP